MNKKQTTPQQPVIKTNPETLQKLATMQTRLALPAAGDTAPGLRTNITKADTSGSNLTLPEVATRLGLSLKTVYRRARAGQLTGAHKVISPTGEQWVVPVATVEQLAAIQTTKQNRANPDAVKAAELQQQVHDLQLELATVRAQAFERGETVEQMKSVMRSLTVATEQLSQVNDERNQDLQKTKAALVDALNRKWWHRFSAEKKSG